jgi:DNA-directed RNA polymerase alpha subunit
MTELDIDTEALLFLRTHYRQWLRLGQTTLAERRLATMKIEAINAALGDRAPSSELIEDLLLPVRPYNVLKREGVNTVGHLLSLSDELLLEMRGMREQDVAAIHAVLGEREAG